MKILDITLVKSTYIKFEGLENLELTIQRYRNHEVIVKSPETLMSRLGNTGVGGGGETIVACDSRRFRGATGSQPYRLGKGPPGEYPFCQWRFHRAIRALPGIFVSL